MEKIYVKEGDNVPQGKHIGLAGNTGNSTGRHLHFGVYRGGVLETNAIPPMLWSGVKNGGTTKGNSDYDNAAPAPAPPVAVTLKIGPVSTGDRQRIEQLAKEMDVPVGVV